MPPSYSRAELERRICEALETGARMTEIETRPGFPSRRTVWRWARESELFAQALRASKAWARRMRWEGRQPSPFQYAWAQAFLERVRRGEPVRTAGVRLVTLRSWKRERPDFAADLAAALRARPRRPRPPRFARYTEALSDAIILRLHHGEPMWQVLTDPALPSDATVRRWRRAIPEFDGAVRTAVRRGWRRRGDAQSKITPEVAEQICERIVEGASIAEVGRAPDMPHSTRIYARMRRDPAFARKVREACEWRDWFLMDEAGAIAEAVTEETLETDERRYNDICARVNRMARRSPIPPL